MASPDMSEKLLERDTGGNCALVFLRAPARGRRRNMRSAQNSIAFKRIEAGSGFRLGDANTSRAASKNEAGKYCMLKKFAGRAQGVCPPPPAGIRENFPPARADKVPQTHHSPKLPGSVPGIKFRTGTDCESKRRATAPFRKRDGYASGPAGFGKKSTRGGAVFGDLRLQRVKALKLPLGPQKLQKFRPDFRSRPETWGLK